jgi:magnesium-protoporphyrin IX monomethyl ester (oxidative) cyclase
VFCSSSRYWNKVRFHSAEYVVREIEHLYKTYKTQVISFYDDLFIAHRKRLAVIVEKIREQNLHKKVIFTCSARANLINEQITHLLKRMNVRSVGLGLESGNEQTLKYLKGGSVSVEDNFRCADLLVKYGINANASFVIGSPMETEAQITDTYDFIKRSKISLFDVYLLTPLPGTPIWEEAKRRNLVCEDEKMDWSILNVNFAQNWKQAIILSKTLNREQLWKIYKKFLRLRLWRNAYKIWSNPFLIRLPGYLSKHIRNRIKYLVKIEINKRLITAVNLVLKP